MVSCEKENDNLDNPYLLFQKSNSKKIELDFFPVEVYNTTDTGLPFLKIKLSTWKVYPCSNFTLVSSQFVIENEYIIRIEDVKEHDLCLTSGGPARSYIDLPETANKLIFLNGERIDEYQIIITDEKVSISPIKENFTNLLFKNTFRYPKSSFAYICGTNLDNTYLYTDFLKILNDSLAVNEFEFTGEGRIPYPENSSGQWVENPSRFFTYENESTFDKAGDLLEKFVKENVGPNDGVSISLSSWNNRNYYSWMINN